MTFKQKAYLSVAGVVVLLILMGGSYAFGRYAVPPELVIQEKLKVVEVVKEVVVEKIVEKEKKVYIADTKDRTRTETTHTKSPDGTETTKTVEDKNIESVVKETEIKFVDREVIKFVDRVLEVDKSLDLKQMAAKDWRVGPMVGLDIPRLARQVDASAVDPLSFLAVGIQVERRIVGPISVGAYGMSNGMVGATLTFEF